MPITLQDIRAGVWLINTIGKDRRRLICTASRGDGKLFIVSDTGHLMVADADPAHLLRLYENWRVEK